MYDFAKVLSFARYGEAMAEDTNCLIDFSKGACEVIVRNPFVDAINARREIHNYRHNKSPSPPVSYQPVIITPVRLQPQLQQSQNSLPVEVPTTSFTQQITMPVVERPPRATCTFCGKSFSHLGDYNKHQRRHTGERPYACDTCPRRFAHASNLQRHRRLHSGEKPFECHTCEKRFSRKDKLAAHEGRRCCKPRV